MFLYLSNPFKAMRIINILFYLAIAFVILSGLWSLVFKGERDFICGITDEGKCIETYSFHFNSSINMYMTEYEAGWGGGGCHRSDGSDYGLVLSGNDLLHKGRLMQPQERYQRTSIFTADPWTIFRQEFTYLGKRTYCSDSSEHYIVFGKEGTKHSSIKGWSIIAILVLIFIFINLKRTAKKKN
jgi:hypothetical protein